MNRFGLVEFRLAQQAQFFDAEDMEDATYAVRSIHERIDNPPREERYTHADWESDREAFMARLRAGVAARRASQQATIERLAAEALKEAEKLPTHYALVTVPRGADFIGMSALLAFIADQG